jgi:hypothetical protein
MDRLSWLTTSVLVYEPKCGGGGGCKASATEHSCANGAQTNFGDLTPYLIYGGKTQLAETWKYFDLESAIKNAKLLLMTCNFRSRVFVFFLYHDLYPTRTLSFLLLVLLSLLLSHFQAHHYVGEKGCVVGGGGGCRPETMSPPPSQGLLVLRPLNWPLCSRFPAVSPEMEFMDINQLFTVSSTGGFLKKIILFSGFKSPYRKIREIRKLESCH